MTTKEGIQKRLERLTKRIAWLEDRLYQINPAKENYLFKKHSNERGALEVEKKRLLSKLKEQCTTSTKN